ncbi:MAG TPA: hypothetical protein VMU16_02525 [Candidatus Binataceae bacterium]|nr:hypothetical protein [Candidatus Binataceae bacterium]
MRGSRRRIAISVLAAAAMLAGAVMAPKAAYSASSSSITLYADPTTGQVYTKPGKHRVKLGQYVPVGTAEEMEQRVVQKAHMQLQQDEQQMRADMESKQAQQQQWNGEMAKQVAQMQPAWQEFGDRWFKKISIGTLVYGDWGYFTHTGFGPQFLTQQVWPGPGNNSFNAFNITRTYLDFKFTPNEDVTMRVTPNMYLMVNTGGKCSVSGVAGAKCTASTGDPDGLNTGWAQTNDGNLGMRIKYAYLDYNTFFKKILQVDAMKDDKFTFGQQQNPLVDWEENLWGFRYQSLTPWNYLSLSSSQVGVSMKGPIKINETQYADYDFGVYDDASFHAIEQSSYKQAMVRVTVNPLGAKSRYDSLGLTYFFDYGYPNKSPDGQIPGSAASYAHIMRTSGLLHYTARAEDFWGWGWGMIGEIDYGNNAFSSGNLYSGSGPSDAIGISSPGGFGAWNTMASKLLGTGQTNQLGWDILGHVDIPNTPFTVFGLWQSFMPNLQPTENPLDFHRYDLGIQWMVNKNLRVALDGQGIDYYHSQFTFPESTFGSTTVPETPYAVPRDVHAFFINFEFRY